MSKSRYYPSTGQSIILVISVFAIQIISGIFIGFYGVIFNSKGNGLNNSTFVLLAAFISVWVAIMIGLSEGKNSIRKLFACPVKDKKPWCLSVVLSVGSWLTMISILMLMATRFSTMNESASSVTNILSDAANTWFGVIYIVIIGPFSEEILFRGVILRGLLKNYSIRKAIIVSSILFGFLHFNIIQFFTAFILGSVLSYTFVKTGSLWACVIVHGINNLLSILGGRFLENINWAILLTIGLIVGLTGLMQLRKTPNYSEYIFEGDRIPEENINIEI